MRIGFVIFALLLAGCGSGTPQPQPQSVKKVAVYYVVQDGDTLRQIGNRFQTTPEEIAKLNRIVSPSQVHVGSKLLVGYTISRKTSNARVTPVSYRKGADPARDAVVENSKSVPRGKKGELLWPVQKGNVISGFGPRNGGFHDGIDISSPTGTPVYAAHSGVVVYAGDRLSGYGNLVVLRHATGLTTVYAHNSELYVSTGDHVTRGEHIARVGATGHATGPHLHFEVRTRDKQDRYVAVDPMPLLNGEVDSHPRYRVNEGLTSIISKLFRQ